MKNFFHALSRFWPLREWVDVCVCFLGKSVKKGKFVAKIVFQIAFNKADKTDKIC